MEFIKPGTVFDFMKYRTIAVITSSIVFAREVTEMFEVASAYPLTGL